MPATELNSARRLLAYLGFRKNAPLYIKPIYGLGNRLRVTASWCAISRIAGKPLFVHWGPSEGFDSTAFEDLFQPTAHMEFLNEDEWTDRISRAVDWDQHYRVFYEEGHTPVISIIADFSLGDRYFLENAFFYEGFREFHNLVNTVPDEPGYYRLRERFYRTLQPSREVKSLVDDFASRHDLGNAVGVHIRRGDATDSSPFRSHFEKSSIAGFEKCISHYEREGVTCLLSTDDERVLDNLSKKYGNVIYYEKRFPDSRWREKKEGQIDGCVELFLLSRTRKILGSNWSTFSQTASLLNGAPLQIVGAKTD